MNPSEILKKHEDENEYHFHEVDRKFIIEAMEEEYANQRIDMVTLAMSYKESIEQSFDNIAKLKNK